MALSRRIRVPIYFFLYATILASFSGCLGVRYLKEDEKLLYKQKIKGVNRAEKEALEDLYQQRPNKRFAFLPWAPYVWFYQTGLKRFDTTKYQNKKLRIQERFSRRMAKHQDDKVKIAKLAARENVKVAKVDRTIKEGNLLMRWGEPLAVYDSSLNNRTSEQFRIYLESTGYFNAEVNYDTLTEDRLATVIYQASKKEPYLIDSIFYSIPDSAVYWLVLSSAKKSLVKKGQQYNQRILNNERDRINALLLNNGYFGFSKRYINFQVDTATLGQRRVMLNQVILPTPDGKDHRRFRLDSIRFITDANVKSAAKRRQNEYYNGVTYQYFEKKYSNKILDWRLALKLDSLYSNEDNLITQRQLANLDIFKFININYDTTGGHFIANVFTSPLDKYQTTVEVGMNVTQGLPGPFINGSLKNRNLFGGLEILELTGRFGIEGVASVTDRNVYQSTEYGFNLSILFPQILFPLPRGWKAKVKNLEPKTRVLGGLTFTNRPEYQRNIANTSLAYSWISKKNRILEYAPVEVDLINSTLDSAFLVQLLDLQERGNNLINSFRPSLVLSSSFSLTNNLFNYGDPTKKSTYTKYTIETGGTLLNLVDQETIMNNDRELYQYLKFNIDFRHRIPHPKNRSTVYRINWGLAIPYGFNKILPYERYFFAGGSNGIRAWRPRRLGPGSFTPINEETGKFDDSFEQPAEILLESSIEFRHKLFGPFRGAFFLDAGNSWTLRDDPARPGSQFKVERFWREIALGVGYGLRLDFSFLIIRLDTALKLIDPAREQGSRFVFGPGSDDPRFSDADLVLLNLGIGYPF